MIRRIAFTLLVSVHGLAFAGIVNVPGDHPTIQSAIDAAVAGDVVEIKAGRYNEALWLKDGVSLSGESRETVTVCTTVDKGSVLCVQDCPALISVSGITFEHTNKETSEQRHFPDAVLIKNSNVRLSQCTVRKSAGCGISVTDNSQCEVTECLGEESVQGGVFVKGAHAVVSKSQWRLNHHGILVMAGEAELIENSCDKNNLTGIWVLGPGAKAQVSRNTCTGNQYGIKVESGSASLEDNVCNANAKHGIDLEKGAVITASRNVCRENKDSGISVFSVGTTCDLQENACEKNENFGIVIQMGAACKATANVCSENGQSGMMASRWLTKVTFSSNKAIKNNGHGICVQSNCSGELSGNECSENRGCGILIVDEGTSFQQTDNLVHDNAGGDAERREGLGLNRQIWAEKEEAAWLLSVGNFEILEQLAAKLHEYQPRPLTGPFQLEDFYTGLILGWRGVNYSQRPIYAETLDKWAAAFPDSAVPLVVKAQAEEKYAWEARGGGYVSETTPQGRQEFKNRMKKAEALLVQAETKPNKDAHLYEVWLNVALCLNYDKARAEDILKKGVALDPYYSDLYWDMTWYLTPRWHGEPGDAVAFINRVGEETRDRMGNQIYCQLVSNAASFLAARAFYDGDFFSWERVDQGFQELMKEYPESTFFLNRYCVTACTFQQQERAKELFARIGHEPHQEAWGHDMNLFKEYKRWAAGRGDFPPESENIAQDRTRASIQKNAAMFGALILLLVGVFVAVVVVAKGKA